MSATKSKTNSLQAVLDRQKQTPLVASAVSEDDDSVSERRASIKSGRKNTVLIGGHFPPSVAKQLGILAAEEGTTKQALLREALDLLFVKKGKGQIQDLPL